MVSQIAFIMLNVVALPLLTISVSFLMFFLIYKMFIKKKTKIIIIRKDDKIDIFTRIIKGKNIIKFKNEEYPIDPKAFQWTNKGDSVLAFDEGNPLPRMIKHNKNKWLDMRTITQLINEEHIKNLLHPTSKMQDMFFLLGSIASIVSALGIGVLILLQLGIITQ